MVNTTQETNKELKSFNDKYPALGFKIYLHLCLWLGLFLFGLKFCLKSSSFDYAVPVVMIFVGFIGLFLKSWRVI